MPRTHRTRKRQAPIEIVPCAIARDRKSTRLNSSHLGISYAVFCLKKKKSVREKMFAYFDEMRSATGRHGGEIEKFVGEAVIAVFCIPPAPEDDAMRPTRESRELQ